MTSTGSFPCAPKAITAEMQALSLSFLGVMMEEILSVSGFGLLGRHAASIAMLAVVTCFYLASVSLRFPNSETQTRLEPIKFKYRQS